MSEELLVRHCSPTLAGLKAGSMFPCYFEQVTELVQYIRHINKMLVPKGLRALPLRSKTYWALILVYRPTALKKVLNDSLAKEILRTYGYEHIAVDACVCKLVGRFHESEEFPHEVGLFLGYPPEDVYGFIANKAKGDKCVGTWKVYGNEEEAKKTFAKYKKCTDVYCTMFRKGRDIERLTVAG